MPIKKTPVELPDLTSEQLENIASFYDSNNLGTNFFGKHYRDVLAEYYKRIIPSTASVLEIGCGHGGLLERLPNRDVVGVDLSQKQIDIAKRNVPNGSFYVQSGEALCLERTFDYVVLSDTINEAADVQQLFESLKTVCTTETRIVMNFYNTLWKPILQTASVLGMKSKTPLLNWLSNGDLDNFLCISGMELVKRETRILCPVKIPILSTLMNAVIAPFVEFMGLSSIVVARVLPEEKHEEASVTIVVPARNESGNIEAAITRTPEFGTWQEIIFIEGGSSDDTWEEIQRVQKAYPDKKIRIMQQTQKGKGNAVREAYAVAEADVLMILDADLTMPPEDLPKYYNALINGQGEFINGVRLVYPMEDEAMRFLNMCANKFFGILFSWLISQQVRDTLCGTKVIYKRDYEKIAANRKYFGDFDPFGDFDLIFGATKLNLKIRDIPIRYRNRSYGDTNISRFRNGITLLRMAAYACRKLKFL